MTVQHPQNPEDPLSVIAFVAHSEWRIFLLALARMLKERNGSVLHLYVASEQERVYYEARGALDLFASITSIRNQLDVAKQPVEDVEAVFAEARRYEERTGTTYNMFAVAHRHFGRGFSLGGYYHPRSRYSEESTYPQIVNAFNTTMRFWEKEISEKRITLMMNGWKEAPVAARMMGAATRGMIGARYKNHHYWHVNEFYEAPLVARSYERIKDAPLRTIDAPYDSHMQYRAPYLKSMRLKNTLYRMGYTVLQHLYWRVRGYEKAKSYYMSEEVRFHWRTWRQNRTLTGKHMPQLADLEGKKFVFFPLHAEPESSLQVVSPEYFFQLGAIASIARDLPAGYYLVVKETFQAFGRRPRDFYGQIKDFKNVILLDMLEFGLEVARKADAVVTITGTAGFEAAVMGKPVITFGRHNLFNLLPQVMPVTREEELAPALHKALIEGIDRDEALAAGARFLQAVIDNGFDMAGYDVVNPENVPPEILEGAYQRLIESFEGAVVSRPAAEAG